jgi:hypothetical protein
VAVAEAEDVLEGGLRVVAGDGGLHQGAAGLASMIRTRRSTASAVMRESASSSRKVEASAWRSRKSITLPAL